MANNRENFHLHFNVGVIRHTHRPFGDHLSEVDTKGGSSFLAEDYYDIEHEVIGEEPKNKQNSSAQSRARRHVGAPDHGGYQRLMATGSIVTSLGEENNTGPADSIDVVFTTYWQYPAKVRILLPEDKACIEKYRKLHASKPGNACRKQQCLVLDELA